MSPSTWWPTCDCTGPDAVPLERVTPPLCAKCSRAYVEVPHVVEDKIRATERADAKRADAERERDKARAQAAVARAAFDEARALDGHKLCRAEHFAAMQLVGEWSRIAENERARADAAESALADARERERVLVEALEALAPRHFHAFPGCAACDAARAVLTSTPTPPAPTEPRTAHVWRCSCCGEGVFPGELPAPSWRWSGTAWEHQCGDPQAGYFIGRDFGPPPAPTVETCSPRTCGNVLPCPIHGRDGEG